MLHLPPLPEALASCSLAPSQPDDDLWTLSPPPPSEGPEGTLLVEAGSSAATSAESSMTSSGLSAKGWACRAGLCGERRRQWSAVRTGRWAHMGVPARAGVRGREPFRLVDASVLHRSAHRSVPLGPARAPLEQAVGATCQRLHGDLVHARLAWQDGHPGGRVESPTDPYRGITAQNVTANDMCKQRGQCGAGAETASLHTMAPGFGNEATRVPPARAEARHPETARLPGDSCLVP